MAYSAPHPENSRSIPHRDIGNIGDRTHLMSARRAKQSESRNTILPRLIEIIQQGQLSALFQPIVNMTTGEIIGYEGLIRGPSDSPLHSPMNLFRVASAPIT
jgi:sensor c-di-GMP phosphodiesterase-like protein